LLAALDHRSVEPLVLVDVELEQLGPGRQRRHLLDRMRRQAGDAEPHPEPVRGLGHRAFAIAVECALQRGRAEHQRQRATPPHDRAGGIDGVDAREDIGHQIDIVEGGGVARLG
jgi:hypothetical protein